MSSDEEWRRMKTPSWSPGAVSCLLDNYGEKFSLGRGYLRNKDWEEVMNCVNNHCEGTKFVKTMKQCRDKVDSLKRRYKMEKRKAVVEGSGAVAWPYFNKMDQIVGSLIKPGGGFEATNAVQNQASVDCVPVDDKLECSGSPDECAVDSIRCDAQLWEPPKKKVKAGTVEVDGLSQVGFNTTSNVRKVFSRTGTQESADDSSERKTAPKMPDVSVKDSPKKRKAQSSNPMQALADAVIGFSEVFARIELAKMEIFTKMKLEMAKLERKRRKRQISSSSSSDTE